MIGVLANVSEQGVVWEFFELFKTPWEFYRSDRQYDVLLCAGDVPVPASNARLVAIYGGRQLAGDDPTGLEVVPQQPGGRMLAYKGVRLPIYSGSAHFGGSESGLLQDVETQQSVAYLDQADRSVIARIGYDLFAEIRMLLTAGQPADHAAMPALEIHIALLRELIVLSGASLVEIPPTPPGYRFIACLTHDIDHPSIRRHRFDHTMFGFLYRAVVQSLFKLASGRISVRDFTANWTAALKLPFVYLGLAKDFWLDFVRYPNLEGDARSSFFVIPFQGEPGRIGSGDAPSRRAAGYGAADIAGEIRALQAAGCEIGLHGIDAWRDSSRGRAELEQIREITGTVEIGVRMHWLYFDQHSPVRLEEAGADYDSTVGYNDAVGYRAGTTQVYKPLDATRLLELPLHVMDTALFYPARMSLTREEARTRVSAIVDNAARHGGVVTINWHDRSIAPERCWGGFYAELVKELRDRGAWFATASETVAWFRKRRAARFDEAGALVESSGGGRKESRNLPPLHLHVHGCKPARGNETSSAVQERIPV